MIQQFGPRALIQVDLHEEEKDTRYLISVTRKDGSSLAFYETFETLQAKFQEAAAKSGEAKNTQ